ncbi:MAG: Uncharacterised protein [Owenweeksia sp. TMED14]|nr:MAG: Uncharacterised protein [Owenweeksia sp. TMED14]|tara:strand:- start:872 stop:1471 length:600 start_codon:yes stop_codon:yes gene_type:complete
MKYFIGVSILILLGFTSKAQTEGIKFYVQGGVNYNTGAMGIDSAMTSAEQVINDIKSFNGWQAGFTVREYRNSTQYLSFESLYAYSKTEIISGVDTLTPLITENLTSQTLQLAISPGFRIFKLLRGQAGLNAVFQLNKNFQESFETFKLGYRLGVGLDVLSITADLAYNASFNPSIGILNGIPLSNGNSQFILSIGYKF